jgi:hypothetical protein
MEEQVENSEHVGYERHGGDWYYHNEHCKKAIMLLWYSVLS